MDSAREGRVLKEMYQTEIFTFSHNFHRKCSTNCKRPEVKLCKEVMVPGGMLGLKYCVNFLPPSVKDGEYHQVTRAKEGSA